MLPSFVVPYLVGAVTAPLVGAVIKPIVRGTVKTTISIALQMKKLAAEAAEGVQDLAAELSADFDAPQAETHSGAAVTASRTGTRPAVTAPKKV
ncbi:MAG: DUF5132 domain-containing protein [Pseudonocardiaceae bacterium]